uniref:Uncharacterized protein n=1 Tax=Anopheles arabiensis TaxID=7173 RepID=A0A182IH61_ANOAR
MRKERRDGKGTRTNVHTSALSENENTGGGGRQRIEPLHLRSLVRSCVRARARLCVCVCV